MDKIILIGAGGHARSCVDVIELLGKYKIAGFLEEDGKKGGKILGYPIIGTDNDLENLRRKYSHALITIGQIKNVTKRIKLYKILRQLNYKLRPIISPRAYVSKYAQIGEGTIVMHDAMVNANASIGENCIINSKTLIEHDAKIGDHCHIATGAILNGEVTVGDKTFVGSGTVTKQCVSIGNNCFINANLILQMDIKSDQIVNS